MVPFKNTKKSLQIVHNTVSAGPEILEPTCSLPLGFSKWQHFHQGRKEKQQKSQSTAPVPPGGGICIHCSPAACLPPPHRPRRLTLPGGSGTGCEEGS